MNKRGLVIGLLVMLAVITSGFTYAFWAQVTAADPDLRPGSVNVGVGEPVTMNVTVGDQDGGTDVLVPEGRDVNVGQSSSIEITYLVSWANDAALSGMVDATIVVDIDNIKVGGEDNPHGLINVDLHIDNVYTVALGGTRTIKLVITMEEPANQAEYNDVAGKEITFVVTFTVSPTA